jgi:hypothetical protein
MEDPCVGNIGWSVLGGAAADSALAGVLAGFLIVAATALLVQWNDRSDSDTFALFASGVPALTLSSYLFTVLSPTQPGPNPGPKVCGQVWGQWLPAFAMLLIGASVLLCGLGWALVSYSDNLAVKLIEKNQPMKRVEESRRFFISLSGWLSLGGTTAMTCWLIAANIIFLKATTGRQVGYGKDQKTIYAPLFEFFHVKWYLMFFVFLIGLDVVVRSAYLIIWRTRAARQENVASCIRYVPGVYESRTPLDVRENKLTERVAQEICIVVVIALGTLLAEYLTNRTVGERFSGTTTCRIIGVLVVGYAIARLTYYGIVSLFGPKLRKQGTTESFAEADVMIRSTPSTEIPEDAIRIKFSLRRLGATSYHVVFFAILGTVLGAAYTQGSLSPNWRTGLTLLVGGLYPAGMLLGLSYAVPAGPAAKLPEWKTWPVLRLIP